IINLQVHGHLMDDKEPALEIIDNWNTFMRQAEDFMIAIDDKLHELPSYLTRITTLETKKADKTEVNELASKKADKTYVDVENSKLTAQLAQTENELKNELSGKIGKNTTDLTINMFNESDRAVLQGQ